MIPIGRFAQLTGLTVRALRHYESQGLLMPARVDRESGYRYYAPEQLAEALHVRLLRALEMPLPEVVQVMRAPELFGNRRAEATHAAVLVERIRQDEAIHVAYLQTAVSELRSFIFRTPDGRRVAGSVFLDPIWEGMVQWHAVTTVDHARMQTRAAIAEQLLSLPDGTKHLATFDALEQRAAA